MSLQSLVNELAADEKDGRQFNLTERLVTLRKLVEVGNLQTLEPLLPILLNLDGRPYSLQDHHPFQQLFNCEMPQKLTLKTGRQVSKSTFVASHGVVLSNAIGPPAFPHFTTLYVTPLYEQIRRFSNNYVRPFVQQSPVRSLWTGTETEQSVLQRSFKNHSKMIFSFALQDADRIRGIKADKMSIDEVQDMDPAHLPVIREVMSYSPWAIEQTTGTPKTLENTLEGLWQRSSQAEWLIWCHNAGCGEWNIPAREYHIEKMIGPMRADISEERPAVICHKCGRPLLPRAMKQGGFGRWHHRYPEKAKTHAGYHVPQICMPIHFANYKKWQELLLKRETIAANLFWNEVLGESYDMGSKLITKTELMAAATLPWDNNPEDPSPEMLECLREYDYRVLAIDWGGGGEDGVSYTVYTLMGITAGGKIDVLWARRSLDPLNHVGEAQEAFHWYKKFNCDVIAHDYSGAGTVRETWLYAARVPIDDILPIQYVGPSKQKPFEHVPPGKINPRHYYRADKTRTLLYTVNMLKFGQMRTFKYDFKDEERPGLLHDFLALTENKVDTHRAGDIYTIQKNPMLTDDFAQAVNFGCCALWHMSGQWPDFSTMGLTFSQEQALAMDNAGAGFSLSDADDMGGFLSMP